MQDWLSRILPAGFVENPFTWVMKSWNYQKCCSVPWECLKLAHCCENITPVPVFASVGLFECWQETSELMWMCFALYRLSCIFLSDYLVVSQLVDSVYLSLSVCLSFLLFFLLFPSPFLLHKHFSPHFSQMYNSSLIEKSINTLVISQSSITSRILNSKFYQRITSPIQIYMQRICISPFTGTSNNWKTFLQFNLSWFYFRQVKILLPSRENFSFITCFCFLCLFLSLLS